MKNGFTEKELLQILQQAKQLVNKNPTIDAKTVINQMIRNMSPYINTTNINTKS